MRSIRFMITLSLLLCFVSCKVSSPLAAYIALEQDGPIEISLQKTKLSQKEIPEIYKGISRINWSSQAASFTESRFKSLLEKSNGRIGVWTEEDVTTLHVVKLIAKSTEASTDYNKLVISLSDPVFLKKEKLAFFRMGLVAGAQRILFDGIVIMEKRHGKWKLLEKVRNSAITD